jgi:hypothetical protein
MASNIAFGEVRRGGITWNLTNGETDNSITSISLNLAAAIIHQPSLLPLDEQAKVLVLNCCSGCAGIAALQLNYRDVVFVDKLDETLQNVWRNVFLNVPDCMTSARCFATGGVSADLNETSANPIW